MSNTTEKQTSGWIKKILLWPFHSPISALCLIGILYFGFKAYVMDSEPELNKLVILAIAIAWLVFFILKHLLVLIFLIVLAGGIFYAYYQYTNRPRIECEENGGVWNEEKQTCEKKTGIMAEIQKVINKYKNYIRFTK